MESFPTAIPAATLILMRSAPGGPELLVMERSADMVFAGGAIVFPGGRIDPDDRRLADTLGAEGELAAARIAAIRETVEEVGIGAGFAAPPDHGIVREMQARLRDEEPFSVLLEAFGLQLDLAALTPFAHWLPQGPNMVRRFDTMFFIAEAPADAPLPTPAPQEATRSLWMRAADVLTEVKEGRARAIFPTRRNLERIAQFRSFEEVRAHAEAHPVRTVTPWIEDRDGEEWLCIPERLGYPVTAERLKDLHRG